MSDEQVHDEMVRLRWAMNAGLPFCPQCGVDEPYRIRTRKAFKCKACKHQYSVTSGTIFASHKKPLRVYLFAMALFVNAAKGISALQLSRDMAVAYKTAFVIAHKLREALYLSMSGLLLNGPVEVDGTTLGGHRVLENHKRGQFEKRIYKRKFDNRRVVVVAREKKGRTLTWVVKKEADACKEVSSRLHAGTIIHADCAHAWDNLNEFFDMLRINHDLAFSDKGACTNNAESYFSLLKRMQYGVHHKFSGTLLHRYAAEMAWRQDFRKLTPDQRTRLMLSIALTAPVSKEWSGYWARGRDEPVSDCV